jgi:uncharacterized membrane protein YhdT
MSSLELSIFTLFGITVFFFLAFIEDSIASRNERHEASFSIWMLLNILLVAILFISLCSISIISICFTLEKVNRDFNIYKSLRLDVFSLKTIS